MRQFVMHLHDDRMDEPQVFFMSVLDLSRAQELAMNRLGQSPHHRRVVLLDGEEVVASFERAEGS